MLTVPQEQLSPATDYWLIEYDTEAGHDRVEAGIGRVAVYPPNSRRKRLSVESVKTGFSSEHCQTLGGQVQVWGDDEYYMAIFPDQASMKQGAQVIINAYGDSLSVGVYRQLNTL